jgi:hypothetical protein
MEKPPFRPLRANERALVERFLEPKFPGRDELRAQLENATARALDDDGCFALDCSSGPPAPIKVTIAVEGECLDRDGEKLYIQLHVLGGLMKSVEMYREDGAGPMGLPDPMSLKLFASGSEEAGVWTRSEKFK